MQIKVLPYDWGEAQRHDIKVLLTDTASHLNRLLRSPFDGLIHIERSNDGVPRVLYRSSTEEPISILLSARNKLWSKFAYQFSHEFCHVLSDYERLKENPNNWFHEAICEVASLFTLRRMAHRWLTEPPFPNWKYYAKHLMNYTQEIFSRPEVQLPEDVSLKTWVSLHEEALRRDCYQRNKNTLVAKQLLPIFKSTPEGWNAISRFPSSSAKFPFYLDDWHSSVESADKPFVERLSNAFGYTV